MIRLRDDSARTLVNWIGEMRRVAKEQGVQPPRELIALSEQVEAQLANPGYETQLIDEVHRLLMGRRVHQTLSFETLALLRSAIFRPTELIRFKANAKETARCAGCNLPIRNMTLVVWDGDANSIMCTSCANPSNFTCGGCRQRQKITGNAITRILTKFQRECPTCAGIAAGTMKAPEEPQPVDGGGDAPLFGGGIEPGPRTRAARERIDAPPGAVTLDRDGVFRDARGRAIPQRPVGDVRAGRTVAATPPPTATQAVTQNLPPEMMQRLARMQAEQNALAQQLREPVFTTTAATATATGTATAGALTTDLLQNAANTIAGRIERVVQATAPQPVQDAQARINEWLNEVPGPTDDEGPF